MSLSRRPTPAFAQLAYLAKALANDPNAATLFAPATRHVTPWSFERIFAHHYEAIAAAYARAATESAAYAVIVTRDNTKLVTRDTLKVHRELGVTAVSVGRHSANDVVLAEDPSVALRHLVVTATRQRQRLHIRVLDLNTGQGFVLEDGRRADSVHSTGDLFVRVGSYALMFFAIRGRAKSWPTSPESGWDGRGPRVYHDLRTWGGAHEHDTPLASIDPSANAWSGSVVTMLPAAREVAELVERDQPGASVARLTIRSGESEAVLTLGAAQLEQGILVGRYRRCDVRVGVPKDGMGDVSRVHALLIRDDGHDLLIDAGSKNGLFVGAARVRLVDLGATSRVRLARTTELEWLTRSAKPRGKAVARRTRRKTQG